MRIVVAAAALAAAAFAPTDDAVAALQMYKCIIGGRTVYQQQGCPVDAEPAASAPLHASAASAAQRSASGTTASAPPAGRHLRPAAGKAASGPATPR